MQNALDTLDTSIQNGRSWREELETKKPPVRFISLLHVQPVNEPLSAHKHHAIMTCKLKVNVFGSRMNMRIYGQNAHTTRSNTSTRKVLTLYELW